MSEISIKEEIKTLIEEGGQDDKIFNLYEDYKKKIRLSNYKNNDKTSKIIEIIMILVSYSETKGGRFSKFASYKLDQYTDSSIDYTNIKELIILKGDVYSGDVYYAQSKIPSYFASVYDNELQTIDISGDEVKVVVMPGVTGLGHECFSGCSNVTKIALPNTVTMLESKCLQGTGISTLNVPSGVKEIGEYALSSCENLETVTGMESVTKLNDGIFMDCIKLNKVDIHNRFGEILITQDIFTNTGFREGSYGLPRDSEILKKLFVNTKRKKFFDFMTDKNIFNSDCKFETDEDVTKCILKTFDGGNTGVMYEVLKYIGDECENLGFMKPNSFEDFKKLYRLGLRCFNLYYVRDVPPEVEETFNDTINVNVWPIWETGKIKSSNSNVEHIVYNSWRTEFEFLNFNLLGNQDNIEWPGGKHKGFGKMLDDNGILWGSTLPHEISGSLILDKLIEPIGIVGGFGKVDNSIATWNETKDIRLPASLLPDKVKGLLKLETDMDYFDSYADEAAEFFKVLMGNLEDEDELFQGEFGEQWNNYNNGKKYILLGDIQTSFLPSFIEGGIYIDQWFPTLGFGETSFLTNINGSILFPKYNGYIGSNDDISWLPSKINGDLDLSSVSVDEIEQRDLLPKEENVLGELLFN